MTTSEVAKKNNLSESTILYRGRKIGIIYQAKKKHFYTDEEIEKIVQYKRKDYLSRIANSKNKIPVIDAFLELKQNSVPDIFTYLNEKLTKEYISNTISEYLKNNKIITVQSKMNYDN